uniref:G-patch domain-containing protein n=1 Tax=Rhabditophanes sp. KR3021 TaxID=114890 RepID=A0AC35TP31_9BILA
MGTRKTKVSYGKAYEAIEDEVNTAISKKPQPIHEQIVTDEKGRRRLHGAFTGGFSAGYFNSVGSKHGWVPTTYVSHKGKKGDMEVQRPEDFMDEEDLGEFGFASTRLKMKNNVIPSKRKIEGDDDCLGTRLESMLNVKDNMSIGFSMMRKMGWREGQGLGAKVTRRQLEKMRVNEKILKGFDENRVKEIERYGRGVKFCADDVKLPEFELKTNQHGLGYKALDHKVPYLGSSATKKNDVIYGNKSKIGFRGQAFGVGAFEKNDDDVYSSFDMNNYDFELGPKEKEDGKISSNKAEFVLDDVKVKPRTFYKVMDPPRDFRGKHTIQVFDFESLPNYVKEIGGKMSLEQKALFFGEVKEVSSLRREPKAIKKSRWDEQKKEIAAAFPDDPVKNYRYSQFVDYARRGLYYRMPAGISKLEFDCEIDEFKKMLPEDLRTKYKLIEDENKPLVNFDYMEKMRSMMNAKFVKDTEEPSTAVGSETAQIKKPRIVEKWHPCKDLCKRFNIPDPYPNSDTIGLLINPNRDRVDSKSQWKEIERELQMAHMRNPRTQEDCKDNDREEKNEEITVTVIKEIEKPSLELLASVFDSDSDDDEKYVEEMENKISPTKIEVPIESLVEVEKLIESSYKSMEMPGPSRILPPIVIKKDYELPAEYQDVIIQKKKPAFLAKLSSVKSGMESQQIPQIEVLSKEERKARKKERRAEKEKRRERKKLKKLKKESKNKDSSSSESSEDEIVRRAIKNFLKPKGSTH